MQKLREKYISNYYWYFAKDFCIFPPLGQNTAALLFYYIVTYEVRNGHLWCKVRARARSQMMSRAHARETPYVIRRVSTVTLCDTEHALCVRRACSVSHIVTKKERKKERKKWFIAI